MHRPIAVAVLAAALSASSGIASAQGARKHEARPFSRPTERVEARLAYIRTALKITDAQQPQWNAFADSLRQGAAEREKKMQEWWQKMAQRHQGAAQGKPRGEHPHPSVIERMQFAQKMHAEAIEHINARLAAVKPLYDSLSAEQKKVADVVLAPEHRGHGFGGGHHGMAWRRA